MPSVPDLDRFLAELGTRRERLLQLAEPTGDPTEVLVEEMYELSEQLLVADEELRVQQEELEHARRALTELGAERDRMLGQSGRAVVVTDVRGVVDSATPAVERLIRQPPIRTTPRPLATWFAVADRGTVRSMISRVLGDGAPQRVERVTVLSSDGEARPVALRVEQVPGTGDGRVVLRWELTPVETVPAPLRLVPAGAGAPDPLRAVVAGLGAAAATFAGCRTAEGLRAAVLEVAVDLVPGTAYADLVLGGAEPDEGDGSGRTLVLPLTREGRRLGVLTLQAAGPDPFGADAGLVAAALAEVVAVALAHAARVADLEAGLHSRAQVGGAVGMLVERHRIPPEEALARLVRRSQDTNTKLREIAGTMLAGQGRGQVPGP